MSGIGQRMIDERRREVAVDCTALYAMQAHRGNPYFSWRTVSRTEREHWINQAETIVPPVAPIVHSSAWEPQYPAEVRLAPDGETSICDQCGRRWRPLKGEGPNCPECSKAWARIANGHERKQNG